ncbi:LacI family DNA-binding transcriptional regulator [Streptomyces sp. DSM 44915]|uniref:LacI family DNA-binding transcriptional regulator n=1 Tax=Streptomyces chisholmiae TaxID=3075540 RepID=A0ABU2JM45_9ACTN|nr:LacI family DNA-binding transcriptional regulator [Streptomyces sp. DSM 44915]MDT0266045.1 LacI family DNA-binding transcriptional regulator [Streptomyces sp. DSM 44915]
MSNASVRSVTSVPPVGRPGPGGPVRAAGPTASATAGPTTLRQVARAAEVSMATVSRVLAGNYPVAPPTRQRVLRAVRELDYVANAHARALRGHATPTVALVLADLRDEATARIAQGVEEEAAEHGRGCLIGTTGGDPRRERAVLRSMRQQGAGAVVLIGDGDQGPAHQAELAGIAGSLAAAGSRLVLCGRPAPTGATSATVVDYDNEGGAYALVSDLLARGHRQVLFLGPTTGGGTAAGRLAGYRRALTDHGLPVRPALLAGGGLGRAEAHDRLARLLATRRADRADPAGTGFSAVFAVTDQAAAGALTALRAAGLSVPDDISLVGYGDSDRATDLLPQLSTVHVPYTELGRAAVRLALAREPAATGRHAVLPTHLVPRHSTAPPPPA